MEQLQNLEHAYVPFILRLFGIVLSSLAILLHIPKLTLQTSLVCMIGIFTNVKVPLERLRKENTKQIAREKKVLKMFSIVNVERDKEFTMEQGSLCPVCIDEMQRGRKTKCGHVFHAQCLRKALSYGKGKCPLCRTKLLKS